MTLRDATTPAASRPVDAPPPRRRLFRKYVGLFVAVMCAALVANGVLDIWFSFREQNILLMRSQQEQAKAAAAKIAYFVKEIEGQLAWATQLPWSPDTLDEWRFDAVRLLRQVPAVTEVAQLDATGRELVRVSRLAADVVGSQTDYSQDDFFVKAVANKIYYGPIHFLRESEPYMTIAMAGVRRDYGVIVAQVNLKFIWDVVSQIQVGVRGRAYVVDPAGRLIAHPDISMVLRNTDVSHLAQVEAARQEGASAPSELPPVTDDIEGRPVLSVHAPIAPLGWLVFVELPVDEAYAPLYGSIRRSAALLVAALALAAFAGLYLARRMTIPIRALHDGAARIGRGDLDQRISIKSGDELQALGEQFNRMAAQLQDSYASLERKVEERTHQLELANFAKSRFLAVASHDLRQPLHALGLFVAQLRSTTTAAERNRIVERIESAIAMINELFKALLDISKLDAGALTPSVTEFPVARLFERVQTTFAGVAKEVGLDFRVVPTQAWVRSDFVLLEQILLNLVSNAVRYVARGGILIGCRRRGQDLRIEICDTGPGIPDDQRQKIFGEFYRLDDPQRDRRGLGGGLGLGLAIVDRLCRLLQHPIELSSRVGSGSRFSVVVPVVPASTKSAEPPAPALSGLNLAAGKLIVEIDDDALALDGMGGLLRSWGCRVVAARSAAEALIALADAGPPDLVISDFHLTDQRTGIDAIEQLRTAFGSPIPAFLVSGDISPALLQEAQRSGYHLLHKPVDPMPLRTMLNRLLKKTGLAAAGRSIV
ncbi:MAG TPA: ATP-binding protein [Xanthobacteraceae bacterium]|nr:ATP-binding protein [Xanthobacteraceae bacterium]